MIPLREDIGPVVTDGIENEDLFLQIAKELGEPIPISNGSFIKTLKVTNESDAPVKSLSAKFGAGMFPFHTDVAFWSTPARLVLLRAVSGDLRRPTYVKSFRNLLEGLPKLDVIRSAWICDTGMRKFYTTLCFDTKNQKGFRYDPNCMRPANLAAKRIEEEIKNRCFSLDGYPIQWQQNRVAMISNWTHLHARGFQTDQEQGRILQRIYIK